MQVAKELLRVGGDDLILSENLNWLEEYPINGSEMYLIKEGNFILYNIETKNEENILENIGKVYFQISDDGQYFTYQEQWGNRGRRKIYFVDLHTMEKKEIHVIKTNFLVKTEFSPDSQYIFIMDSHWDTHLGKNYYYLYDINKEKKYRVDIDDLPLSKFVGWGKENVSTYVIEE